MSASCDVEETKEKTERGSESKFYDAREWLSLKKILRTNSSKRLTFISLRRYKIFTITIVKDNSVTSRRFSRRGILLRKMSCKVAPRRISRNCTIANKESWKSRDCEREHLTFSANFTIFWTLWWKSSASSIDIVFRKTSFFASNFCCIDIEWFWRFNNFSRMYSLWIFTHCV